MQAKIINTNKSEKIVNGSSLNTILIITARIINYEPITQILLYFHDSALIARSIAIVRRTEKCDNLTIMCIFKTVLHHLVAPNK